jgi:hypothetical protein
MTITSFAGAVAILSRSLAHCHSTEPIQQEQQQHQRKRQTDEQSSYLPDNSEGSTFHASFPGAPHGCDLPGRSAMASGSIIRNRDSILDRRSGVLGISHKASISLNRVAMYCLVDEFLLAAFGIHVLNQKVPCRLRAVISGVCCGVSISQRNTAPGSALKACRAQP